MTKSRYPRNAKICNEIDTLESSIEKASATALFYLEKNVSFMSKVRFPHIVRFIEVSVKRELPAY